MAIIYDILFLLPYIPILYIIHNEMSLLLLVIPVTNHRSVYDKLIE